MHVALLMEHLNITLGTDQLGSHLAPLADINIGDINKPSNG
jgi:hypothetical protein